MANVCDGLNILELGAGSTAGSMAGMVFADAGALWHYVGPTQWIVTNERLQLSNNDMFINSSVGAGILWASPFGPIRFDLAFPLTKQIFDRKQMFRFGGGTTF